MKRRWRSTEQVHSEIKAFCLEPKYVNQIIMHLNITYKQFKNAINAGVIEKIGEEKRDWCGPKAHIYQTVKTS